MAFVLGLVFYVVVVGMLDARLPWPRGKAHDRGQRLIGGRA